MSDDALLALRDAVQALDPAAADGQPYDAWDAAKWKVFNAAVRLIREHPQPDPQGGGVVSQPRQSLACYHCGAWIIDASSAHVPGCPVPELIAFVLAADTAPEHQWQSYMNGTFCTRCGAAIGSGMPCR